MQLIEVPAKQGYVWLRRGTWLLRKSPIGFLLLLFIYLFAANLLILLVPPIEIFAVLLVNPAIFVDFMSVCRDTVADKRVRPASSITGFHAYGKDTVHSLLKFGGIYGVLVLVVNGVLMIMVDANTLVTVVNDKPFTADAIRRFYPAMMMGSVLYIPVVVLFWFAPLLVTWHDIPMGKALFFNWMAVWRSRTTFIAYGALVAILLVAVPLFIDALFASSGANNIVPIIAAPHRVLVMTVLHCSFYAICRGCFNVIQTAGQTADKAV